MKPHAVCVPLPFQSHINAMLKLAKILHLKGFHITFVNTEFNHQRVLITRGTDSLKGLSDFRFETIPDGLPPPSDINATQDIHTLFNSITETGPLQLRKLITRLNQGSSDPPVSCIISDTSMVCTVDVAQELGIPQFLWWPMSLTMLITSLNGTQMFKLFSTQLKDKGHLTEEFLDMPADFIPGLKGFRLRDFTKVIPDLNMELQAMEENNNSHRENIFKVSAIILNTFDVLESEILDLSNYSLPPLYTVGPLHFLEQEIADPQVRSFGFNLLKEHDDCLEWLDSKQPNSVVYVNFGSTTVMTREQFMEFAWGLANSKYSFLWIIRPGLVTDGAAVLSPDLVEETAERSMISGWCPQEKVLGHPAIGGFLTHSGWNSIMDAMCAGVPIINWPFFADQQPNCRLACGHWGIGMEIDRDVKREAVEGIVTELMEGEKGIEMKRRSMEWKRIAEESTKPGGSSYLNLDKIVQEVLVHKKQD